MKKLLSVFTSAVVITACAVSFTACGDTTPIHTHDYGTEWVSSATHHWHECKNDGCDQKEKDKAAHLDSDNNGKCDTCDYTLKVPVASVELSQTEISLEVDGTATLTASVSPDNATNKTVAWESDKTNIATVDNTGKVTAIAEGTAKITATADGKSADCTVTVTAKPVPVTDIELDKTTITLEIDETETLTATLTPDNATDKTVTWTVAPAGVVSVENGVITALKDGTATITATANGKSANCSVTVNAPLTNAQVLKFLNDNVLMEAAKHWLYNQAIDPETVSENNISNVTWYIAKDDKNITGVNLIFNYLRTSQADHINLYKVDFGLPLTVQNIRNNELGKLVFTEIYSKSYNPTIQAEHTALTNAICDKLFGEKTNATRYIIDEGTTETDPQFGSASRYIIIEVSNNFIKEKNICIKYAKTDSGLIANLADSAKYYTYGEEKNVAITGEKLENNENAFYTKTPLGNKVTNGQIKDLLNDGYREKVIDSALKEITNTVDYAKISNESWYITKSETGNLLSATLTFYYQDGTKTWFEKPKIIFQQGNFTYDDYLNTENGEYAEIIIENDDALIEDTAPKNTEHSAFVNAVMNKFRSEWNLTNNAIAEFKSLSTQKAWQTINGVEDVEVRQWSLTIYDGDIRINVNITIKYATSDSEYITNLNNNLYQPFGKYGSSITRYSYSAWVKEVTTVNGEKL